jgi:hypothetical protein
MKSENCIEFSFAELHALAELIAGLNKNGVPYTLTKDGFAVRIAISTGY